jgi:opacity protein-like surface antigen
MRTRPCRPGFLALAASFAVAGVAAAAPATHYVVTLPDPTPFYTSTSVHVSAVDDAGAVDTGYAGTGVVSSSDPRLVVVGPLTFTAGVLDFDIASK